VNRAPGFHGTMLTAEVPVSCTSTCISSTGVNRAHLQQAVSTDTQDGHANPRQLQRLHHNNHTQLSIKQLNMNIKFFNFYFSVIYPLYNDTLCEKIQQFKVRVESS